MTLWDEVTLCAMTDLDTVTCHHCRAGAANLGDTERLIEGDEE